MMSDTLHRVVLNIIYAKSVDEALLLLLHDPGLFLMGGFGAVMGTGCYMVTQATYS